MSTAVSLFQNFRHKSHSYLDGVKLYNIGQELFEENPKDGKKNYIQQLNLLPLIGSTSWIFFFNKITILIK